MSRNLSKELSGFQAFSDNSRLDSGPLLEGLPKVFRMSSGAGARAHYPEQRLVIDPSLKETAEIQGRQKLLFATSSQIKAEFMRFQQLIITWNETLSRRITC